MLKDVSLVLKGNSTRIAAVALSICASNPDLALAQVGSSPVERQAQRIQEQIEQRRREQGEQFEGAQDRPPSGEAVVPDAPDAISPGECVRINEIRLVGMARYRQDEFATPLGALGGDCVTVAAINEVLRQITNRYVRDGYVTSRAVVAPQGLDGGVLTATVIEGRTGVIRPEGSAAYGTRELHAAFPNDAGDLLNLRNLEQGVDQLARMAGSEPSIDIVPGAEPGTSDILVKRRRLAGQFRPSLSFSNDGLRNTGRWQSMATLDADSPLGIGDVWSVYYSRDLGGDSQRGTSAWGGFLTLPYGWWVLSLSGGGTSYESVLEGNGLAFAARGSSWHASAMLERIMYRDAKSKWALSGGLALIDADNFIQGIRLTTGSYRIVRASVSARWQRKIAASQMSLSAGFHQGLGIFGAQTADMGPGGPTGKFAMMDVQAALQSPFKIGPARLSNSFVLRGQWGFDNLFPAQRFSLGGASTVRGFLDDGISGRTGLSFREQLNFGIVDLAKNEPALASAISGFLAYDFGVIRPVAGDPFERGAIQSMSTGLRLASRHVQGEFMVSLPLSAPAYIGKGAALISASVRIML